MRHQRNRHKLSRDPAHRKALLMNLSKAVIDHERVETAEAKAIAALLLPASQALVDAGASSAGQEVLDVAAGSGNLAVLAAMEGASVVASDISPGQVELGQARTEAEGLSVEWVEADVEELPF